MRNGKDTPGATCGVLRAPPRAFPTVRALRHGALSAIVFMRWVCRWV